MLLGRLASGVMSSAQKRALKKAVKASALARRTNKINTKRLAQSKTVQANLNKITARRNTALAKVTSRKVAIKQAALSKEVTIANLNDASTKRYFINASKKRAKAQAQLNKIKSAPEPVYQDSVEDIYKLASLDKNVADLTKKYQKLSTPLTTKQVARRELAFKAAAGVAIGTTGYVGANAAVSKVKTKFKKAKNK
jgi:hypothetical protein